MNIQDAAYKLLQEEGRPLSPEELARRALERGMVTSRAGNAIFSLQSTLRKNIRDGVYNHPKLITLYQPGHRGMLVAMPQWQGKTPESKPAPSGEPHVERKIQLPAQLAKQIELVKQAGIAKSFDDAVIHVLRKGWEVVRPTVHDELNKLLGDNGRK
jgi:hypothetical protein